MKIKSLLSLAALAFAATSAFAGYIKIADTNYDGDINGGEFLATTSVDNNYNTLGDNYSFLTFCLEKKIHIGTGNKGYTYTISNAAQWQNDVLSIGSAWLYEQFFKGTLGDASGGGAGSYFDPATRDYNAGELQKAFWALENEANYPGNYYVALAQAYFGGTATDDITSGSRVKVVNVWGPNGEDVQDLLIYVPDSGMTVALLGLGLLSLAAFRRKTKS